MPGPLYFCANGCRVLAVNEIPPGLFAATTYETLTLRLQPGDSVLFCTDGITTDAFNRNGEQFGIEQLQKLSDAEPTASPNELLARVFAAVECFAGGR
jgi:serine phosphatase RsbU (regulator of sigma subunit)